MPYTLIEQKPTFKKKVEGLHKLAISEMFCDTLQGEGISTGKPATFMRLQGCTLKCNWCDTLDVWSSGNEYSFDEIFALFEQQDLIRKFEDNEQRLVLTGGSPLKQQDALVLFLNQFIEKYNFKPVIEVENEAVLMPNEELIALVNQWNNSPKLANSGMKEKVRIKPDVLKKLSSLNNSWFKFVIRDESDWREIIRDYIKPGYVEMPWIILMPEGDTQEKLSVTRPIVADIAIKWGVRFTDRLHVTIWDKKTGV